MCESKTSIRSPELRTLAPVGLSCIGIRAPAVFSGSLVEKRTAEIVFMGE